MKQQEGLKEVVKVKEGDLQGKDIEVEVDVEDKTPREEGLLQGHELFKILKEKQWKFMHHIILLIINGTRFQMKKKIG